MTRDQATCLAVEYAIGNYASERPRSDVAADAAIRERVCMWARADVFNATKGATWSGEWAGVDTVRRRL